jgi:hypothetical protein
VLGSGVATVVSVTVYVPFALANGSVNVKASGPVKVPPTLAFPDRLKKAAPIH